MKKIGILFGQENTFPWAFVERVNEKKINGIVAEAVSIDKVVQGDPTEYAVIIDRISQDVPFYRAYLKMQPYQVPQLSITRFGGRLMRNFSTML